MRPIIKLFVLFCVVLGVIAGYGWWWSQQALTLKTTPVDFRIPPGTGLRGAIGQIQAAGVDVNANALLLLARVGRAEAAIKAGSYSVAQGITPAALLEKHLPAARYEIGPGFLPNWDRQTEFDLSASARDLGYVPAWTFEDGLEKQIDWIRSTEAL